MLVCLCQPVVHSILSSAFSNGQETLVVSTALRAIVEAKTSVTLAPSFVQAFGEIFKNRQGQTVNSHNDAHEALMCMFVWLQAEKDPFDKVLRLTATSTTRCDKCTTQSSRQEKMCVVMLAIPEDLRQHDLTTIQAVYNRDLEGRTLPDYVCLECKSKQPAVVKVTYESNPSGLLVLYLCRSHVCSTTGRTRKHGKQVVSPTITHAGTDYVLVAVACHKNNHYFAYVARWENKHRGNIFYRVDDETVVNMECDRGPTEMWTYGYLLFYAQKSFFDLKMK